MLKKILITGGSGFIGTNLVAFYHSLGHKVLNLDTAMPKISEHLSLWENVDLCNGKKLNFLNLLKLILEDKKVQKLYCDLLGEYNLQYVIKTYIDNIPGFYKKIFRSKFNR